MHQTGVEAEEPVKPAAFGYARAVSLNDAIEKLATEGEGAKILAGGQSLMATLNMRLSQPRLLIDISRIDALRGISRDGDWLRIGALTRYVDAERSADLTRLAPLIARALPHIAHPAIRNRGTFGGSVAYADPAAELPACLLALAGEVEIAGPQGTRRVAADDFFQDLYETALAPDEILTAIRIPVARAAHRCGFGEFARRAGDFAMVGLAASAVWADGRLTEPRLAYFGVGTTPVRARAAEAMLAKGGIEAALAALADDIDPTDDMHASAGAKRHLAGVLLRRVAAQLQDPLS